MGTLSNICHYFYYISMVVLIITGNDIIYVMCDMEKDEGFEKLLKDNIEKILAEKLGQLDNDEEKKSEINKNNGTISDQTISLMDMVRNVMNESGAFNSLSDSNINNTNMVKSQDQLNNTNKNSSIVKLIDANEVEHIKDILTSFLNSSLTNKIDEAKRQLTQTISERLKESITNKNNKTNLKNINCYDVYKECADMKKNGACKSSKILMEKNCKKTCGFCKKGYIEKIPKLPNKPHKGESKKIKLVVHKKQKKLIKPKKKMNLKKKIKQLSHQSRRNEAIKKLKKLYRCRLHCKKKCTPDCPKECCKNNNFDITPNRIQPTKRCSSTCPQECAPDCSFDCCYRSSYTRPPTNYYPLTEQYIPQSIHSDICYNDINCPPACYPSCLPECCNPNTSENNPVDILTRSVMNNLNNGKFFQRNQIIDVTTTIPPPIVVTSFSNISNLCPPMCVENECNTTDCPDMCCNTSHNESTTTENPVILVGENNDTIYRDSLTGGEELVLTDCSKDCIYKCTDTCYRNKCCDKK